MISEQDLFDKAAPALLEQGEKSLNGQGGCVYRGGNGCKCAIGHLIPDDRYRLRLERFSAAHESVQAAIGIAESDRQSMREFLRDLQRVHDNYAVCSWRAQLGIIARRYYLTTDCIGGG